MRFQNASPPKGRGSRPGFFSLSTDEEGNADLELYTPSQGSVGMGSLTLPSP